MLIWHRADAGTSACNSQNSDRAEYTCQATAGRATYTWSLDVGRVNEDLMTAVEIRSYCGDFEDVAELMHRVWLPEYRGRLWVPIPDAEYLRWRFGPGSNALCPAAYEGAKLVGTIFSAPTPLRISGSVYPASLSSVFTVDPDHRRIALSLVQHLRRCNEEHGIAITTGMVLGDPASISYRFWTKYAETFPQNFRFLFRGTYLAKFLSPQVMAQSGIRAWERVASRALGPILGAIPYGYDQHVRPYCAADLEQCVRILEKASAGVDFALVWPSEDLSYLLSNPTSGTLVFERAKRVAGIAHYHIMMMQGRDPVRAALLDLWADDNLSSVDRIRFVAHLCRFLRDAGVHAVVAPRCAMMPQAALLANLFVPVSDEFYIGVHMTPGGVSPSTPRSWSFVLT
jgi:hypothetical protein